MPSLLRTVRRSVLATEIQNPKSQTNSKFKTPKIPNGEFVDITDLILFGTLDLDHADGTTDELGAGIAHNPLDQGSGFKLRSHSCDSCDSWLYQPRRGESNHE